jgi:hypothetical protein
MDQKAKELKVLIASGIPLEDAATSLGIDKDAAIDFLNGEFERDNAAENADDFIAKQRLAACKELFNIGMDVTGENTAARVNALRLFAEGIGNDAEVPIDKISAYYKKVKDIQNRQRASTTLTTPSSSTSVVDINAALLVTHGTVVAK